MRVSIWAMLAVAAVSMAAPAQAQTYNPRYPVCLEIHDVEGGWIDCAYDSIPQCQASAAARAAQCRINPFFSGTRRPPEAPYVPPRRAY
jgi:Protein of unknown function (DUF3551)